MIEHDFCDYISETGVSCICAGCSNDCGECCMSHGKECGGSCIDFEPERKG